MSMTISRRSALQAMAAVPLTIGLAQAKQAASVEEAVEAAHKEIWRRFVQKPYSILLDFNDLNGDVILPTPEECVQNKPNALDWFAPNENGAFFGGIYLDGLINRWKVLKTSESGADAKSIVDGLMRLASVGKTTGFIARGVCADGKSHHVCGSDDQSLPWFYGMWRYAKSDLPSADERKTVVAKMVEVATVLDKLGWHMPCDDPSFGTRGEWTDAHFIHAPRVLFVPRAMFDLTGDERWKAIYERLLHEKLGAGTTRLAICSQGAGYLEPGTKTGFPANPEFWTTASSQAALKALVEMETNVDIRAAFQRGLDANAKSAAAHIPRFRKYDLANQKTYRTDWRYLNEWWQPQTSVKEALAVADRQGRERGRHSPRHYLESMHMREPLFAAWVVVLSGNQQIIEQSRSEIGEAIRYFRWNDLYTSLFFVVECVHYQMTAPTA